VRNVEREGQQSGNDAKLFSKVVPSAARSARTFVITRNDSTVWSSVITTSTLGFAGACVDPAPAEPATPAPSTTASRRADPLTLRPCQTSVSPLLGGCSDQ
jgi:hypothetical protein